MMDGGAEAKRCFDEGFNEAAAAWFFCSHGAG